MSTSSKSSRWFLSAVALAAAVLLSAAPVSAGVSGGDACTALTPIIKGIFGSETPPSESTGTVNGTSIIGCTWRVVTVRVTPKATARTYQSSVPKSATAIHGVCSKAAAETGTNTVAVLNAKTGKSTTTTTETQNLWCYRVKPPEELEFSIDLLASGYAKSELAKAEKAANDWMQRK